MITLVKGLEQKVACDCHSSKMIPLLIFLNHRCRFVGETLEEVGACGRNGSQKASWFTVHADGLSSAGLLKSFKTAVVFFFFIASSFPHRIKGFHLSMRSCISFLRVFDLEVKS